MLLLIIVILIAAAGTYVNISENHSGKAAAMTEEEFCKIECRNYTKRYD